MPPDHLERTDRTATIAGALYLQDDTHLLGQTVGEEGVSAHIMLFVDGKLVDECVVVTDGWVGVFEKKYPGAGRIGLVVALSGERIPTPTKTYRVWFAIPEDVAAGTLHRLRDTRAGNVCA